MSFHRERQKGRYLRLTGSKSNICESCGFVYLVYLNNPFRNNIITIHHKDFDRTNGSVDNLILLCRICHELIHSGKKYDRKKRKKDALIKYMKTEKYTSMLKKCKLTGEDK